ncbi:MAG: class I tRNA ligase family protein [Candidatus Taylorbacteria bacterium]|nr:class I tRNA ligase family protein [Candidatus Taylorbacteria bacterium]
MKKYDHSKLEKKWQKEWEKSGIYAADDKSDKKRFYPLVEFPFPSGAGLHTGHIRSYTAMDIVARKRRMQGENVLYPIGWDAFGLPTENYAIKTGRQPEDVTKENTDNFRRQLKSLGLSFDWSREVNTTDPEYFRWTQWIFLKMYEKGLAYKAKIAINWCPKDKIGLANEEVVDGRCERCGTAVEEREKEQWMLAITKYADKLYDDLDSVDYLERIKIQQRNWIGRSEGAELEFAIKGSSEKIRAFTTRPDTLFGVTYVVLAPEHGLVSKLSFKNRAEVEKYIASAKKKDEIERTDAKKEKTGVKLDGIFAINPANGEEVPVFVADYVLSEYGTGAVMAVPAHDERDFAFAKKYGLPVKHVVEPKFVGISGEGAPRADMPFEYRDAVAIVVRNPKDGKYLCNSWKSFKMHGLFTGGIEKGEDIVEAAKREMLEETGYKNLKHVRTSSVAINTFFYHRVKKQNRHAHFRFVFFDLVNEERQEVDDKEAAIHEIVWKERGELKDFFTVYEGSFILNILDSDDYIYTDHGILADSGKFSGMDSEEAKREIAEEVGGAWVKKFKLRDWVFSRQRYWGEPIPMVKCGKCGWVPVPEKELPVALPKVERYEPTDTGESPLAEIRSWVETKCPKCKGEAERETDTMPNWAGSSWYYLRYADPKNNKELASKERLALWSPVDWYNGGMEHTTLHLLYSRFWHKFLFDIGIVPTSEPYKKRTSHGMILAEGGEKMSKSKGNVINPDELVTNYGADTLRVYEMFMGPFDQAISWDTKSLIGPRRFIERIYALSNKVVDARAVMSSGELRPNKELESLLHKTIGKVTGDIESMGFNTAVSSLMILSNALEKEAAVTRATYEVFLKLLAPFAPHVTEDLWHSLGNEDSIHMAQWPVADESKLTEGGATIVVQVNGKVRASFAADRNAEKGDLERTAMSLDEVKKWIGDKKPEKVIVVPGKLVSIVVRG